MWRNCSVVFYPLHQVFFQEYPLLTYLVGGQTFLHQLVDRLMTNAEEFLCLSKGEMYPLNIISWFLSAHSHHP